MKWLSTITYLICSFLSPAQSDLNSELLEIEKMYFSTSEDDLKTMFVLDKIDCYLSNQNYSRDIILEANRINPASISDSTDRLNFYWNMCIVGFINNDLIYADDMLYFYHLLAGCKTTESTFLQLQISTQADSLTFIESYNSLVALDSSFSCLSCLTELGKQEKYNKRKHLKYSKIIPGLGTIKAGDARSGIFSMVTHLGTIAGAALLFKNQLYFNSLSWGFSLLPRFYSGNKVLTSKTVNEANKTAVSNYAKKCQKQTLLLLAKYPIEFKY